MADTVVQLAPRVVVLVALELIVRPAVSIRVLAAEEAGARPAGGAHALAARELERLDQHCILIAFYLLGFCTSDICKKKNKDMST